MNDFSLNSKNPIEKIVKQLKRVNQNIQKIQLQLNRVYSPNQLQRSQARKARTRTLIQLGGLLEVSGIAKTFAIELGQDLQRNPIHVPKIKELRGFLKETILRYQNDFINSDRMDIWRVEGIKYLTFYSPALLKRDKGTEASKVLTLIQLGAEVNFMGLPALFNIELGSDLELDERFRPKAAMLAGFFDEIHNQLQAELTTFKKLGHWEKEGAKLALNDHTETSPIN